jgi:hypothetical protein
MVHKYNIRTGVKRAKTKIALTLSALIVGVSSIGLALAVPFAASAATTYTISPWTFVGAAGDCGVGYPAGTPGGVVSKWDNTTGNPSPSLFLQKNVPTTDCSSAGATVNGVNGITLTELNFQYQNNNGGHCGAGAPRYNVVTTDNVTHFFGCIYGTHTDLANGWTQVEFSNADGVPAVVPGEVVQSIDLVFDEGIDQGSGFVNLDNFSINGQIIGGPNTPASKDACKNDGWKTLQDANGHSFKNQGDCVSYVATGGKNQGNGH